MPENKLFTGHLELDDQHLVLAQCFSMVKLGIDGKEDLEAAVALLRDTLELHLNAEGLVLWQVLTPEKAMEHQQIHDRALQLVQEYWRTPDPGRQRLQRILQMIHSHMHSAEEAEMLKAARAAVRSGQTPRRI